MLTTSFVHLISIASIATAALLPVRDFNYSENAHIRNKRAYTIKNQYQGSSFFTGWKWWTSADPTNGLVNYVSQSTANSARLAYVNSAGQAVMRVDNTSSVAAGGKRNSVRIESQATVVNDDLVIFDAAHVPYGCSVWPACKLWMYGTNWPNNGEIDIFEGVNGQTLNHMTLHSLPGCTRDSRGLQTGTPVSSDCSYLVNGNQGCAVQDTSTTSYGAGFARAGGGVWAMQWAYDGIFVWRFPRSGVPADITNGAPNPANWGPQWVYAWLATTCTLSNFFGPQNLVFDITICGDWAGQDAIYRQTCSGTCSAATGTASNYNNAYFVVNSVKVYHQ